MKLATLRANISAYNRMEGFLGKNKRVFQWVKKKNWLLIWKNKVL